MSLYVCIQARRVYTAHTYNTMEQLCKCVRERIFSGPYCTCSEDRRVCVAGSLTVAEFLQVGDPSERGQASLLGPCPKESLDILRGCELPVEVVLEWSEPAAHHMLGCRQGRRRTILYGWC